MNASNWVDDNGDMPSDQNNRYHLDNVGLHIGLGLPLQLLGVSLVGDRTRSFVPDIDQRWVGSEKHSNQENPLKDGIQQTVDGIPIRKVYITNLSIEVQRHNIYNIFGQFGPIMNVYLGVSKNDPYKQFAFITFADPKDAARVLIQRRFHDAKGRWIYAAAADSWHQPKEGPNGQIMWRVNRKTKVRQEEESEDEEQVVGAEGGQPLVVKDNEEGINVLNDDCLLHIFSFLPYKVVTGVERVCKRWQALSFRMWRFLHQLHYAQLPLRGVKTTALLEQYLRRCGESLTLLDLRDSNHNFNESTLAIIAKYCNNLEVLRLANIYVGNRSLAHLARSCSKLKQLLLDDCVKLNDTDLISLLPKCQELNHLELTQATGILGKCLASIEGPINTLSLSNCTVQPPLLISGLQKMSNTLHTLSVSACGNLHSNEVEQIVKAVPNLTSLSLCRCFPQFDLKSLAPISQLINLTHLNLFLNNAVNDTVLAEIVAGCENLTSVNLSGSGVGCAGVLSDRGISLLARLRKLTELDISYLEAANNTALKNISARSSKLKQLYCRGCPDLSDDGSVPVVTMCNDLEVFDLSGCENIGEKTVSAALTSIKMRTNNVPLKLIVGGTNVQSVVPDKEVPQLTVDLTDFSEEHLRPDFIDDMFFPPSDSEDEEDLDDLCERIGCDCDFDFDDLHDPTLFPCDFDDDTPKFGVLDDVPDTNTTHWIDKDDEFDDDYETWDD